MWTPYQGLLTLHIRGLLKMSSAILRNPRNDMYKDCCTLQLYDSLLLLRYPIISKQVHTFIKQQFYESLLFLGYPSISEQFYGFIRHVVYKCLCFCHSSSFVGSPMISWEDHERAQSATPVIPRTS